MLGSLCVGSYGLLLTPPGDWRSTAAGVRGPLPALPGETPQISAQRQQALELLHRHCDPVMQDADAMNRDEVRLPLRSQPPHFVKDLQAQLAARSYLEIGTTLISGRATPIAYFDGAPWGGVGPEAFVLAVHLATWMDPQPVGRMAAQLDVAIHCLRHGRCTADEVTLHALGDDTRPSPETLARARALAPRLFAAMQAGRVDPFLPPSAPKP
ncbi:hypothetical protein QRD43_04050 [Pelomonas sp. APW6]|uniref:Uncharacterized protein n=1 Tax=Roseateles subflavus TaxID=3053353 RepID=A0ABT7LDY8_9BURK|nr:hypothetical protein [Pelomonas sp. APW6]MDL5031071.1 hypothetical protein [Pelomonas sp. APW6]